MSGGRLRSSSGRSPPKAKMAALSWANSGSSRLEQAESTSAAFCFKEGLAAVGRAGGFFWVSLQRRQQRAGIQHENQEFKVEVFTNRRKSEEKNVSSAIRQHFSLNCFD